MKKNNKRMKLFLTFMNLSILPAVVISCTSKEDNPKPDDKKPGNGKESAKPVIPLPVQPDPAPINPNPGNDKPGNSTNPVLNNPNPPQDPQPKDQNPGSSIQTKPTDPVNSTDLGNQTTEPKQPNEGSDAKTPSQEPREPENPGASNNSGNPQLREEVSKLIDKVQDPDKKNFYTFRLQFSSDAALNNLKTEVQQTLAQEEEWSKDTSPAEKRQFSFPKLTEREAIEKIKNKTFSIGYGWTFETATTPLAHPHNGTGWLLDYAWDANKENLMLFIATNLHVHKYAFNSFDKDLKNDFPEYFTEAKRETLYGFLGVPRDDINLEPIPNNTKPNTATNRPSIFTNEPKERAELKGATSLGDIMKAPQTIFAAMDFYNEEGNKKMLDNASWYKDTTYPDRRPGLDFAVFGVEINYKKLTENQNQYALFKKHIDRAIATFDNDVKTIKYEDAALYIPFDYVASYLKPGANKLKSLRPERLYVAGYPQVSNTGLFMSNTSSDLDHSVIIDRTTFTNNISNEGVLDDARIAIGIGYSFALTNSSLAGGTSGSMVTNEYGVPVGIYNTSSNTNGTDLSQRSGFVPLIQGEDLDSSYAYNLIDGSDKTKYPMQEKSYRQNLAKLDKILVKYPKTALFPNGVKQTN